MYSISTNELCIHSAITSTLHPIVVVKTNSVKGANCSKEGKKYEIEVFDIVRMCKVYEYGIGNNTAFNTQSASELGGCNSRNDIECDFGEKGNVPIEIKKMNTPDWMQCSLKYDTITKCWIGSEKNKIPNASKHIFENLLRTTSIFNGKIPPFISRKITHDEWLEIKNGTDDYNDFYISCPDDTIKRLYREKGCRYIQISEKGLFHLGDDICGFGVPEFICNQKLRVRTKIHSRSDVSGLCRLSVTVACQPINIKKMTPSKYSLDSIDRLPFQLIYS